MEHLPTNPAIEETLRKETDKWLARLEDAYSSFTPTGKLPEADLRPIRDNIEAYIKDSRHFLEKGDLVRAFEAAIYAWGLLESCSIMHLIESLEK